MSSRPSRLVAGALHWARIAAASPASGGPRLSYGHARVPKAGDPVNGGMVKFQRLQEVWPNEPTRFNVLYLGSSSMPWDWRVLLGLARLRHAAIAWNQNGVAYPGWAGERTARLNRPMAAVLHRADHVFFQSEFCRLASDAFLGARQGPAEILYNAVDVERFTPGAPERRPLTLVLGGSQYQWYRVERALETVARLTARGREVRLEVTGALRWGRADAAARETAALADRLGIADRVALRGPYTQAEAPAVLRAGDILLHTKYNDPSPGLVVEAMACGLPVVYSASGGVPELVGLDAGVGVPAPLDWEQDHPPDADALADAVETVARRLDDYRVAARDRAVSAFAIGPWLERHRQVFEELAR
jgi:glycosyltransferase involved in cell wall biosynthesis